MPTKSSRERLEELLPKNEKGEVQYPLAYDYDHMQPGCAILQALYCGCLPDFGFIFSGETWLLRPTPGMKTIYVSIEEAKELAKKSNRRESISMSCQRRRA